MARILYLQGYILCPALSQIASVRLGFCIDPWIIFCRNTIWIIFNWFFEIILCRSGFQFFWLLWYGFNGLLVLREFAGKNSSQIGYMLSQLKWWLKSLCYFFDRILLLLLLVGGRRRKVLSMVVHAILPRRRRRWLLMWKGGGPYIVYLGFSFLNTLHKIDVNF
jgi:hypothetical protein